MKIRMGVGRCCCDGESTPPPPTPIYFFPIGVAAQRTLGSSTGGALQGEGRMEVGITLPGADDAEQVTSHIDGAVYMIFVDRPYQSVTSAVLKFYHDRRYDGAGTANRPLISSSISGTMEGSDEQSPATFPVNIYSWQMRNPQAFFISAGAATYSVDVTEYFNYCLANFAPLGTWTFAVRFLVNASDTPLLPFTYNFQERRNPFSSYDFNGQYLFNNTIIELSIVQ